MTTISEKIVDFLLVTWFMVFVTIINQLSEITFGELGGRSKFTFTAFWIFLAPAHP